MKFGALAMLAAPSPMRAFLINLDAATDRRAFMEKAFAATQLRVERVAAIDGAGLAPPIADYAESKYHRRHGRTTKPGEIGCYFSHVKAWRAFFETGDAHGLICEDDVVLGPDLEDVIARALGYARHWNILRLTALGTGHPAPVVSLGGGFSLCVNFGRLKGTGVYVLDRAAAAALVAGMLPMWLPFDHALDREWVHGLQALSVSPFPCSQTDKLFRSTIQGQKARKLSAGRRWLTTYPYQIVNELARWSVRGTQYLRWKTTLRPAR